MNTLTQIDSWTRHDTRHRSIREHHIVFVCVLWSGYWYCTVFSESVRIHDVTYQPRLRKHRHQILVIWPQDGRTSHVGRGVLLFSFFQSQEMPKICQLRKQFITQTPQYSQTQTQSSISRWFCTHSDNVQVGSLYLQVSSLQDGYGTWS